MFWKLLVSFARALYRFCLRCLHSEYPWKDHYGLIIQQLPPAGLPQAVKIARQRQGHTCDNTVAEQFLHLPKREGIRRIADDKKGNGIVRLHRDALHTETATHGRGTITAYFRLGFRGSINPSQFADTFASELAC